MAENKWTKRKEFITISPVELYGEAATVVYDHQAEKRDKGDAKFGKARAIQELLCELYKLKQKEKKD